MTRRLSRLHFRDRTPFPVVGDVDPDTVGAGFSLDSHRRTLIILISGGSER